MRTAGGGAYKSLEHSQLLQYYSRGQSGMCEDQCIYSTAPLCMMNSTSSLVLTAPGSACPSIELYCTVLYCIVLYCTVLFRTVPYCTLLYCTVLYCTVLYCTVLYGTVLHCTVPYSALPSIFPASSDLRLHSHALDDVFYQLGKEGKEGKKIVPCMTI